MDLLSSDKLVGSKDEDLLDDFLSGEKLMESFSAGDVALRDNLSGDRLLAGVALRDALLLGDGLVEDEALRDALLLGDGLVVATASRDALLPGDGLMAGTTLMWPSDKLLTDDSGRDRFKPHVGTLAFFPRNG